jgi:TPR repeat protein
MRKLVFAAYVFCMPISVAHADIWFDRGCGEITNECKGDVQSIYLYGDLDLATYQELDYFASKHPKDRPFPIVYINSDGGLIAPSLEMGRILRDYKATIEAEDRFFPDHIARCSSACVLVSAGAVNRNLVHIGVHQGYTPKRLKGGKFEMTPVGEKTNAEVRSYYREMGITEEIDTIHAQSKSPSEMIDIRFEPDADFQTQKIVQLGFRQRNPDDKEKEKLKRLKPITPEIQSIELAATVLGEEWSMIRLVQLYLYGEDGFRRNEEKGLFWLKKTADLENPWSLHNLAVLYSNGTRGVEKDDVKAVATYRKAALRGYASSQNNLGWHYYKGTGTEQSISEAIYWITRSLEQGEAFAMGSLGTIMFEGNGFTRDKIEIYKWLKLATERMPEGNALEEEKERLTKISSEMTQEEIEEGNRRAKVWRPLKQAAGKMRDKDDD